MRSPVQWNYAAGAKIFPVRLRSFMQSLYTAVSRKGFPCLIALWTQKETGTYLKRDEKIKKMHIENNIPGKEKIACLILQKTPEHAEKICCWNIMFSSVK